MQSTALIGLLEHIVLIDVKTKMETKTNIKTRSVMWIGIKTEEYTGKCRGDMATRITYWTL